MWERILKNLQKRRRVHFEGLPDEGELNFDQFLQFNENKNVYALTVLLDLTLNAK